MNPIILTLDAGGTNFVFSAMQDGKEIADPVRLPSEAADLRKCLGNLRDGFHAIMSQLNERPSAISFAFPGPADYEHGIIGDLPNFPSFRGGIALGAYLENEFGMPVYINNDGNLFAYGEAMAGLLPDVNRRLLKAGSMRQYHNLIGITLGTGFGCGVVTGGTLLTGDNGAGGDVWCLRNAKYPQLIAEESVSIRAVRRVYGEFASFHPADSLTPYDIFLIAEGERDGDAEAARRSFAELGTLAGDSFPRLQMKAYNLDDEQQFGEFAKNTGHEINVPFSDRTVVYDSCKLTGVATTRLGASRAIALGAYYYAVNQLNH